jgi:hypothetical protein
VYCFLFAAGMRQRQKWVDFIATHARHAAARIVNQKVLPVLIVVFNMVTVEDGIWDPKRATEEAQIGDQIKNYFREVHVVCIFNSMIFFIDNIDK